MSNPLLPLYVRNGQNPPSRHTRYHVICDRNEISEDEWEEGEFPKERKKTVLAALLLFFSSLCTSFSLSILNEVVPRDRPLPDIIFKLIPAQQWAWPMSDMLVLTMASVCGFSMLLHRHRWIVLRRIFLIASVLYFLRAVAMLVTWMPLSDSYMLSKCVTPIWLRSTPPVNTSSPVSASAYISWSLIGYRMFRYGLSMGFIGLEEDKVLCGDYIYSGHTLVYVLSTVTMKMYTPRTGFYGLLHRLYPLCMICGMLLVIISRLHYTIDVVIAYWMTTLTFWSYHMLIALQRPDQSINDKTNTNRIEPGETMVEIAPNDPEGDENGEYRWKKMSLGEQTNSVFNLLGSRVILEYFEKNIPAGVSVPRRMNWPYTKPNWMHRLVNSLNDSPSLNSND